MPRPAASWKQPICAALFLVLGYGASSAQAEDTLLLAEPDISASHVAFVFDGDVWIANRDGSSARRLTTAEGIEAKPHFSPDGRTLAFSANYDGNVDVYRVPVTGGAPERLTWHGADDVVEGFDGDRGIVFSSNRYAKNAQEVHLFTLDNDAAFPTRLPIPLGHDAQVSPDGRYVAYIDMPRKAFEALSQWKNYRGGSASRITILDREDYTITRVPRTAGRSNDINPMWVGGLLYFNSDRSGEFNLHAFNPRTSEVTQLTRYDDFPVVNANADERSIVYEQAGRLHVYDPESGTSSTLRVATHSDFRERRPRWVSGGEYVRSVSPSPDLAAVALEFRGEIVVVDTESGAYRNLTKSAGANDRDPAFSPRGSKIAWFSDATGEYALHVVETDSPGVEPEVIAVDGGAGSYRDLAWSPDERYVSFLDNAYSLFVVDIESGTATRLSTNDYFGHYPYISHAWSPDSRWLAYTENSQGLIQKVHVWSAADGASVQLTDGLVEVSEPVFDPSGDYLYVVASDEAGPLKDWFSLSTLDLTVSHSIYAFVLEEDGISPVPPEGTTFEPADDADPVEHDFEVTIDFDGIDRRIVHLPAGDGMLRDLQVGKSGELFFLRSPTTPAAIGLTQPGELTKFQTRKRETTVLLEDVAEYTVARDGNRVLLRQAQEWHVADTSVEIDVGSAKKLAVDDVAVQIDPMSEWRQIAREAWRINRDYFYSPEYHGVDWDTVWNKYEPLLDHAATRYDVSRIISAMLAELRVSHSVSTRGESIDDPETVDVGLLGADFRIENGRYRFDKVLGGLNWRPDLESPLTTPGNSVSAGEYLLAVDGEPLLAERNVYKAFANTAGKQVELTVGRRPDARGARTVTVVPLASEMQLRYVDWVESNMAKVNEATDGRVAYVHVPDTSVAGHESFKRYFFPQTHKQALILDDRDNGGGYVADYYMDPLRHAEPFVWWATRYGKDLRTPRAAIFGPKVMLINAGAGSGGDLLPWMFRKFGLGTLVGTRTWGGLVGNLEIHTLMDGAIVTAPNIAAWTPEEGWIVENEGVGPDVTVEQTPRATLEGRDLQLEQAIQIALDALEKESSGRPARPPYPVHTGR